MDGIGLFALLNPAIGLVFTGVLLGVWRIHRNARHVLLMAGATAFFAVGMCTQLFVPASRFGWNTMLSCVAYLLCLGFFGQALRVRAGVRGALAGQVLLSVVIFALIAFFFYVDDDLRVRVYVLNIGAGVLMCHIGYGLLRAPGKRSIDWLLIALVMLIGLHFIPRTIWTVLIDQGNGALRLEAFRNSAFWSALNFALVILALILCLTFLAAVASDVIEGLRHERNRDPLASLLNRRAFEEEAQQRLSRFHTADVCLIFCDIDHFKSINDTFGHGVGDDVIRQVGEIIRHSLRKGDVAGRIGGEEFVILLGDIALPEAADLAERLRQRIAGLPLGHGMERRNVTASFGVAEAGRDEPLEELMRRADNRLYDAKRNGRNRVEF